MKRVLFLLFFLFINVVHADPLYCHISKDESENYILKSNDEIKIYFNSTYNYIPLVNAKFQLYYDPYVFDIISESDKYVFTEEDIIIKDVKKHSSLIEFTIDNLENKLDRYPTIYIKLRVKDNVKNGNSIVELIGEGSYITQIYESNQTKEKITSKCVNSKLIYKIDNNNNEVINDSHLTYIGLNSKDGYLYPNFSPEVLEYKAYIYDNINSLNVEAVCSVVGCGIDGYFVKDLKKQNVINFNSKINNSTTNYKIDLIVLYDNNYEEYPTLKNLKILKYDMFENFKEHNKTYHVIIPDYEDSLLIDYESNYDVKIEGNENFKIGENIVIITVSNNDIKNKYYIIVQKQEKLISEEKNLNENEDNLNIENIKNDKKAIPNIIVGLILLITLILITVFIVNEKE